MPEELISRRDFLVRTGFGLSAMMLLSGCSRAPVREAIPFLEQPPEITPGTSLVYASVCPGCSAACGTLVKVRDGRPIKVEGNPDHPVSKGGLCAVGQASLLSLYDRQRLLEPKLDNVKSSWTNIEEKISGVLSKNNSEKEIWFICGEVPSPLEKHWIKKFLTKYDNTHLVCSDSHSTSAIADAYATTHGTAILPRYRFDKAEVIVSFDADFLGTWISPMEFTSGWASRRNPDAPEQFSHHTQFESRLSVTGAKADLRVPLDPFEIEQTIRWIAAKVLAETDGASLPSSNIPKRFEHEIAEVVDRLLHHRGKSLVVCGIQSVELQTLINAINYYLGNEGNTVDLSNRSYQQASDHDPIPQLTKNLSDNKVGAVFFFKANPVHDHPLGDKLSNLLKLSPLTVSFVEREDETSRRCSIEAAIPNSFETWNDSHPVETVAAINQPLLQRLGNTRSLPEILASLLAKEGDNYQQLRNYWKENVYPVAETAFNFENFWNQTVHDGYCSLQPEKDSGRFNAEALHSTSEVRHKKSAEKQVLPNPLP